MTENSIAKVLNGIGIATIVLGILVFFIIGAASENAVITIAGVIGSGVSGMMFIGFAEIINLLQQNVQKQSAILDKLNEKPNVVKEIVKDEPKSTIQDIEFNLPQI